MKKRILAFSMAEVMITLVIIGAIAVLTVPGLIDSSNKRINEAAAAKADYVVSQAALRLQAECPRLRCSDAKGKLETLLKNVKANEKITYKVSKKVNNAFAVIATIDGDDTPILYYIDNKGKGARVKTSDNNPSASDIIKNNTYFTDAQKSGINCVKLEGNETQKTTGGKCE